MSDDTAVLPVGIARRGPDGFPFCLKCNKPVDEWSCETPIEEIASWVAMDVRYVHTGEIIITVKCHGEKWSVSNWRGMR